MKELLEHKNSYTYAEYAKIDDGKRYELIDGSLMVMEPGPGRAHQNTISELVRQIANHLLDKPSEVVVSPFDVCLFGDGDSDKTVVQPDLIVVSDLSKLDGKRCNGAPDFAIEIVSPSSAHRDMIKKFDSYMRAGVLEYWIVNHEEDLVCVCLLKDGKYELIEYRSPKLIPVTVLNGFEIDMGFVFAKARFY